MEIKLYGVARGSLHELLNDYEDYMRTRDIPRWNASHQRMASLRQTCRNNNDTSFYLPLAEKLNDEEFCNMMLTVINQSIFMLNKLIDLVKQDFLENGGIKEQMFKARLDYRKNHS